MAFRLCVKVDYCFCIMSFDGRVQHSFIPIYRLNIVCISLRIELLFVETLLSWLCVRVGILLTWGNQLHDCIISQRGEVWVHNTSLNPPHFIEVHVTPKERERSCIFVKSVNLVSYHDCSIDCYLSFLFCFCLFFVFFIFVLCFFFFQFLFNFLFLYFLFFSHFIIINIVFLLVELFEVYIIVNNTISLRVFPTSK